MAKAIYLIGTGTDVGKTIISAGLTALIKRYKYDITYFKPVLSGAQFEGNKIIGSDTTFVKEIAQLSETVEEMTPYIFKTPVSPHLASRIENQKIEIHKINHQYEAIKRKHNYILVEGAGGLMVPISDKGLMQHDIIKHFNIPVLIVGQGGLGTINHTSLTALYAKELGLDVKGIILNQYDQENFCHQDNIKSIEKITGVKIIGTIPEIKKSNNGQIDKEELIRTFEQNIERNKIIECFGGNE